ncbi:TauD/TfdA family dioxygenase [uncultured Limnohabitans sp.]|jgi:hypothetical protein|uniref:TauD/TfdA family dioxygenase n=1 Tax=uncultured Limnohabitans sp. TaxID=768543 RepID=UPI002604C1FB|nr:TauD/TfdA family dioxygenase [uncultured Limnohabitans sp.]
MSIVLKQAVTGPAAWTGKDIQNDTSWIHQLDPSQIQALDDALASLKNRGLRFPDFTRDDFPIGHALSQLLEDLAEVLENGRGFALWRGLPVDRYSEEELNAVYYGLGLHLGLPVCQNPRGDLLGEVMAVGDPQDIRTRVYQTNLYLPYHSDPSDVVGLLCVRKAKRGGVSSLVSVARIYNEILEKHPEYLGLFYRLFYFEHLCEPEPSLSPIFSYHQGKLSCRYLRQYLELGCSIKGVPLSKVDTEALDCFDRIMHLPDIRVDMLMEPGDLQFANNYAVLHSRTDFEDHEDLAHRRRMLRLWLKMPNARTLAPEFPGRNGFPRP